MSSEAWQISNDDLVAEEEFAGLASEFEAYDSPDFEAQVQRVANRIYEIHQERGLPSPLIFGFDADYEGEIQGATVGVACPGRWSLYLVQNLDLKSLTDDRAATGWDQAVAIRDALMASYAQVRTQAIEKGLL